MVVFRRVDSFAGYQAVIPSLAFQYQHQCLVAYKDLTHHWLLLPMLGLGLAMPLPCSAEDGSSFDASAFHLGSPQCTNEESGVVGRPPQVSNPVPASFAQVRLRVVWKVAECHGHRTLSDVVDVSADCDESEK